MPRRSKVQEANYNSVWWRWKSDDGGPDDIIVYTENLGLKVKAPVFGTYYKTVKDSRGVRQVVFAVQYKVKEGSKEQKELFEILGLNESHEKKPKRKSRRKHDENNH